MSEGSAPSGVEPGRFPDRWPKLRDEIIFIHKLKFTYKFFNTEVKKYYALHIFMSNSSLGLRPTVRKAGLALGFNS